MILNLVLFNKFICFCLYDVIVFVNKIFIFFLWNGFILNLIKDLKKIWGKYIIGVLGIVCWYIGIWILDRCNINFDIGVIFLKLLCFFF